MMPAVGVVALWRAVTVPRRGRAVGALLLGSAAGVAVIAWSRAQPVADGAKAGLTLERIGANWTLLVDQCLPYLLGVKVFVAGPGDARPPAVPDALARAGDPGRGGVRVRRRGVLGGGRGRRVASGPLPVRQLGALGLIGSGASVGGFLVSTMPADLLSARYLAPIVWLAPFTLAPRRTCWAPGCSRP